MSNGISSIGSPVANPANPSSAAMKQAGDNLSATKLPDRRKLREAFDQFVGETFYSQMLSSMRKTVGKSAYFDGGRAEEVFQGQLDQVLAEQMTKASASSFTGPMFEQFINPPPPPAQIDTHV